jgi:hypothetical protein
MKKVDSEFVYEKEQTSVNTSVLARKPKEGVLPYCKTRTESKDNNRLSFFFRIVSRNR